MTKEIKTSDELNHLVAQAVLRIEQVADGDDTDPTHHAQVGPVYHHERDDQGRNWDISAGRNLGPFAGAIHKVVDPLRDRYDIANAKPLPAGR